MNQNIFKDTATLQEMLELRQQGWSLNALAHKYNVYDHHAIQYHCVKNGLHPGTVGKSDNLRIYHYNSVNLTYIIYRVVYTCIPKKYHITTSKTYKDYLKDKEERDKKLSDYDAQERQKKSDLFFMETPAMLSVTLNG